MDSCLVVEKEIDKIFNKFTDVNFLTTRYIDELIRNISDVQRDLEGFNNQSN